MMRKWVLGVGAVAMLAAACHAQRGERLSTECRREIVKLCGMDRSKIRTCMDEKSSQLSPDCLAEIGNRMMKGMGDADRDAQKAGAAAGATEYSYGNDALQKLDFYPVKAGKAAPLVIFVHGGGWKRGDKGNATGQYKAPHFNGEGYAFASINYRLVPTNTVEQQAADVATAIAYLRDNAAKLGIDPKRIVVMGHSAGAHLVSLVGTDPQYLQAAGMKLSDLSGIIPLDGAAYDVPAQMAEGNLLMRDTYPQAFGTEKERQIALSPIFQAAAPNAPSFLILHVERDDGTRQSAALAAALRQSGVKVELQSLKGKGLKGHMEINRNLGDPAYPATPIVDAWLKVVFGG
jgi:arylformamidase